MGGVALIKFPGGFDLFESSDLRPVGLCFFVHIDVGIPLGINFRSFWHYFLRYFSDVDFCSIYIDFWKHFGTLI